MRPDPLGFLATELETLKPQGLYRHLRVLADEQKAKTTFDHRQVVNLSSNNYLGLTTHPQLRERALEAIAAARRRLRIGAHRLPARWTSTWSSNAGWRSSSRPKRSVVFQSGFTANAGTVSSILDQGRRRRSPTS